MNNPTSLRRSRFLIALVGLPYSTVFGFIASTLVAVIMGDDHRRTIPTGYVVLGCVLALVFQAFAVWLWVVCFEPRGGRR